jgi:hypothetical protein
MIQRREFLALFGGTVAAWPLAARAQQPENVRRIGVLSGAAKDNPDLQARLAAFQQVLQQLDWTDGRNVRIHYRWGAGSAEGGIGCAGAGRHPGHRPDCGAGASGNSHCAYRVRGHRRSSRLRLRR